MCAYDLMRSSRASNCCWSLGMWRFSGCRSCCARDAPTPRDPNKITAKIWKLGMFKPAVSASWRAMSKRANVRSIRYPAWARKSMGAVPEL
eukprot:2094533-Pyramimonas_sp.AAC.1